MRDRHNIVGTEVGRPRPPIYLSSTTPVRKKRRNFRWVWLVLAAVAVVAFVVLGRGG